MARTPGTRGSRTARRKETGKSPQSMEGMFRALLENSPYVTLLIGPDGTISYENRPVKSLLGYRPEDRTSGSVFDHIHPDDVARAEAALAEVAGKPSDRVTTELRARHADGSWRTLQVIGQNRLDDPALGHIVVSFRDITEPRQKEEALQESEARYSVLVEHAKEGVLVVQDRVVKFANPALSEITGYSNEELQGMDLMSLVVSGYQDEVAQRYESRLAGDTLPRVIELRIRHKDGTERTLEASGTAIPYEGSPAIMGVARDVTERRQMEGALLDSEKKWRTLVEAAPERILTVDRNDIVTYVNRVAPGRTVEEVVGTSVYDWLSPSSQKAARKAIKSVFRSGKIAKYSVPTVAPDGKTTWYDSTVAPIVRDGEIAEVIIVGMDVTGRKQTEEALEERRVFQEAVLECVADGIVACDREGTLTYFNRATREFHGLPAEPIPPEEWASHYDLYEPDGKTPLTRERIPLFRAFKGEDVSNQEMVIAAKGLPIRTLITTGRKLADSKGNPLGAVVSMNDITERKEAEEALLDSEEKWRAIVANESMVVSTLDRHGKLLSVNRLTGGRTMEQMIGTSSYDHLRPAYGERVREALASVFQSGETTQYELAIDEPDGSTNWYETSLSPVWRGGEIAEAVSVSLRITKRKLAEENLQRQEQYFRALIENSLDAIAVLNKDGTRSYASPSYERILGRKAEVEVGENALEYVHEDDLPRAADAFGRLVRDPSGVMHEEIRVWHGDGSLRTVEVVSRNLLDDPAVQGIVSNFRDITLRKAAEEELRRAHDELERRVEERTSKLTEANRALRESETRFRDMASLLPQIVFEIDGRGNFTFANRTMLEITGYDQTDVERGLNAFDTLLPEDRARARRNMKRSFGGEKFGGNEYTMMRKDGTTFPVIVYTSPILKNGKPTGIRGIAIDVTERKQMEEDLKRSEEHFRALIENSLDAIAVVSADGTIKYQSPSIERVMGHTPEDRVGKDGIGFVHPDDAQNAAEVFAQVLQNPGASMHYEMRARHGDGSWRTLEAVARNLLDEPAVAGIVCNIRDITERKEAEGALRASERRFRALIENALDFVGIIDRNGTVQYVGPSLEQALGYTPEERIGKTHLDLAHPDDRERMGDMMAELLQSPGATIRTEGRYRHKDGSWRYIEGSATNLLDDPAVEGIVTNSQDVTERKLAEARMEESYSQEKELRERLETEMKRRVEFTRALAHELKTPLTAVLASSDLLVSEIEDETLLGLARNIRQGASNLDDRIDELLDLARGEVGMLQLKAEPIDLLQLLREAADRMIPRAVEHGQSIVPALPPKLSTIQADAARLEQVVTNLLDNAIKFTPRGGRITLRARESKGQVTVEVQDTGRGIPKEARERLFEPYQRLDSDRENLSGLGLGLSLSKTLIELHGGTIWVKSRVGRGSTFGFTIPLRAAQSQAQEPEEPRKVWKVLIIEDDREIVDFVALNFRLRWPEAELVSTGLGDEGVEMVESEDPNVVILDLGLPDISGFEVLRQIRLFSSVPVIILTVRGDEADMVKGLEWGADDYVVKPFRQSELLARLKVQLRKKTLPDEDAPIVCGSLRLDPSTFQLTHGAEEISLTIVEGRIIEHLMRNAGHVVTHASLAEAVWGEDYPGAIESLRVYIRYIRQKLEADPGHPKLIITKAGVGYSLARPT